MTATTNVDLHLGSPVLPEQVRRARTDQRGALTLYVDPEAHDRGLLYSIAAAVREHTEVVELLREYADISDLAGRAEADGDSKLKRSLEDELEDKLGELDSLMGDQSVGEVMVACLRPQATTELVKALTGQTEGKLEVVA